MLLATHGSNNTCSVLYHLLYFILLKVLMDQPESLDGLVIVFLSNFFSYSLSTCSFAALRMFALCCSATSKVELISLHNNKYNGDYSVASVSGDTMIPESRRAIHRGLCNMFEHIELEWGPFFSSTELICG